MVSVTITAGRRKLLRRQRSRRRRRFRSIRHLAAPPTCPRRTAIGPWGHSPVLTPHDTRFSANSSDQRCLHLPALFLAMALKPASTMRRYRRCGAFMFPAVSTQQAAECEPGKYYDSHAVFYRHGRVPSGHPFRLKATVFSAKRHSALQPVCDKLTMSVVRTPSVNGATAVNSDEQID